MRMILATLLILLASTAYAQVIEERYGPDTAYTIIEDFPADGGVIIRSCWEDRGTAALLCKSEFRGRGSHGSDNQRDPAEVLAEKEAEMAAQRAYAQGLTEEERKERLDAVPR